MGAVAGRFFEAEFEAHHEVDPGAWVLLQRVEHRGGAGAVDGVVFENLVDLLLFVAGALDDYFGEAGEDDDVGGGDGSGETGGEGKRHGETVGEADDDVANGFGGFEVSFDVGIVGVRVGRVGRFLHGGSVVQPAYCWVSINRRPNHPDRKF